MLNNVAKELACIAKLKLKTGNALEADAYARSAINRCYYAIFLDIKELISQVEPSAKGTAHKHIPDYLRQTVIKKIKCELKKQQKNRLLNYNEVNNIEKIAINLCNDMANILASAYAARVIADYHPEVMAEFEENSCFQLGNTAEKDAFNWYSEIHCRSGALMKTLREVGIVK